MRGWAGGLALLALLAGCQAPPKPDAGAEARLQGARLAAMLPCADGSQATLRNGLVVAYRGSDHRDPALCRLRWNGHDFLFYAGFWGDGRFRPPAPGQREAIAAALTGAVGTEASFPVQGATLWSEVTVTHVASPPLMVGGVARPVVALRMVWHDALGRGEVRAERRIWIDQASGIALRRETITPMASGQDSRVVTWDVASLDPQLAAAR
ncbi:MAG: hypothetical protein KGJ41_09380 [Rhodospirillales bacterium]|nr:hypothetical protein [Rhodospirillales bacterium]MDE2573696.1 hypothetical protein [Rhodospirillales bacterium]